MIVVLTKRNTTWTFTKNGAIKNTKSGQSYFPELALGLETTNKEIEKMIKQKWDFQGSEDYKDYKREK